MVYHWTQTCNSMKQSPSWEVNNRSLFDPKNGDSRFLHKGSTFPRSTVSNIRRNVCSCDSFHTVPVSQPSWSGWNVPGTSGLKIRYLSFRNAGTHVAKQVILIIVVLAASSRPVLQRDKVTFEIPYWLWFMNRNLVPRVTLQLVGHMSVQGVA